MTSEVNYERLLLEHLIHTIEAFKLSDGRQGKIILKKPIEFGTLVYTDLRNITHWVINKSLLDTEDKYITACNKHEVIPHHAAYGTIILNGKHVNCRECLRYQMELDWEQND